MNKSVLKKLTVDNLISRIYHLTNLSKQKELINYPISPRQLCVLHVMNTLGSKATSSEVGKIVERDVHVITRIAIDLENEGLITRIKIEPKLNMLSYALTEKGRNMLKVSPETKAITKVLLTLSKEEQVLLESILNRILDSLKKDLYTEDS